MAGILDDYYDDAAFCAEFRIAPRTARLWRQQRKVAFVIIGGRPYYPRARNRELIDKQVVEPVGARRVGR